MPKATHLHRYKKVNLARRGNDDYWVYKCTKPACNHYIALHLAEGKLCECNRCEAPMVITKAVLFGSHGKALTEPHCSECTKRKKVDPSALDKISQFLNKTGTEDN